MPSRSWCGGSSATGGVPRVDHHRVPIRLDRQGHVLGEGVAVDLEVRGHQLQVGVDGPRRIDHGRHERPGVPHRDLAGGLQAHRPALRQLQPVRGRRVRSADATVRVNRNPSTIRSTAATLVGGLVDRDPVDDLDRPVGRTPLGDRDEADRKISLAPTPRRSDPTSSATRRAWDQPAHRRSRRPPRRAARSPCRRRRPRLRLGSPRVPRRRDRPGARPRARGATPRRRPWQDLGRRRVGHQAERGGQQAERRRSPAKRSSPELPDGHGRSLSSGPQVFGALLIHSTSAQGASRRPACRPSRGGRVPATDWGMATVEVTRDQVLAHRQRRQGLDRATSDHRDLATPGRRRAGVAAAVGGASPGGAVARRDRYVPDLADRRSFSTVWAARYARW